MLHKISCDSKVAVQATHFAVSYSTCGKCNCSYPHTVAKIMLSFLVYQGISVCYTVFYVPALHNQALLALNSYLLPKKP